MKEYLRSYVFNPFCIKYVICVTSIRLRTLETYLIGKIASSLHAMKF